MSRPGIRDKDFALSDPAHTLDQLKMLRLGGMAAALADQASSSSAAALGLEDRLALLVQREIDWRDGKWLARLLKAAG